MSIFNLLEYWVYLTAKFKLICPYGFQATSNGIKYRELMKVGNWELKFAPPREPGQLPALIHSQFCGWGK